MLQVPIDEGNKLVVTMYNTFANYDKLKAGLAA